MSEKVERLPVYNYIDEAEDFHKLRGGERVRAAFKLASKTIKLARAYDELWQENNKLRCKNVSLTQKVDNAINYIASIKDCFLCPVAQCPQEFQLNVDTEHCKNRIRRAFSKEVDNA